MNDNDQLLLTDSPPQSPSRSRRKTESDDLLLDCSQPEISTTDNTFCLNQNHPKLTPNTWSSTIEWQRQTTFLWPEQSEQSEEQIVTPISPTNQEITSNFPNPSNPFRYAKLMVKLQLALKLIQQEQKPKQLSLFAGVKKMKLTHSIEKDDKKKLKTQRTSKEDNIESQKRKFQYKKYALMRKSVTEPNEHTTPKNKYRLLNNKYVSTKIINQVQQKQSPINKKTQKQRTNQEFLNSMTNWQERKKIKQLETQQKYQVLSMEGATFTPEINAKSKLLMKKKGNLLPIYQRDVKSKRQNEIPKILFKNKK